MDYTFKNNWREKIASMTEIDDLDIEKTFSDIASGFVSNKVGDLMKDQHRIGFEIVKKNEDNTRMIGVFAFKVDKELIFAPVFFLSGEIKGPLLYRCDSKQFIPATKDWANYLIESIETSDGRGIDKTKLGDTAPMVSLDKIMMRPKQAAVIPEDNKIASKNSVESTIKTLGVNVPAQEFDSRLKHTYETITKETFNIKQAFVNQFGDNVEEGLLSAIRKSASFQPGILKEFLSEEGYGLMAAEALMKAASSNSDKLAEHLTCLYGAPQNVVPSELKDFKKEAAAPVRTLEVHFGFTKEASQAPKQYFKDGFFFFDKRYKEDCCKVTKNPVHSAIHSVTDAGVYDLVKEDGTLQKNVFCAHVAATCGQPATKSRYYIERPDSDQDYIIAIDKQGYTSVYKSVLGVNKVNSAIEDLVETDMTLPGNTSIEKGNVYVAYIKGNDSSTAPFYVIDKHSADGVSFCKVKFLSARSLEESSGDESSSQIWFDRDDYHKIICNRDAKSNYEKGIFGSDVKFIKVKATIGKVSDIPSSECVDVKIKRIQNIADNTQANEWVFDKFNTPTINLEFDKSASYPFTIEDLANNQKSGGMNKFQVMTKLARDLKIKADEAYDLVHTAENTGSCVFSIEGLNKLASRIHIVGRPKFTEEFDQATGIPISENQSFILDTAATQEFDNRPHVGDAMNPTTATGLPTHTVVTVAPDQLRGLADSYNLPNVFEHGAVGTLADTFDANALLNKYLPKLQEAVDSLGRIKFLFYWKPDDFQKSYGSDDMSNLEAEIDSNFESIGDLTLKLLKKSDKLRKGQASSSITQELD